MKIYLSNLPMMRDVFAGLPWPWAGHGGDWHYQGQWKWSDKAGHQVKSKRLLKHCNVTYNIQYMQESHIPEIFHLFNRLLGGVWKPASSEVGIFMKYVFSSFWVSYHLIVQILDMSVTTKECAVAAILLILDQVSFGRQSVQCLCLSSGWLHSFGSLRNSTVHDHHCCIPSHQDLLCPWPSNWPICHHWEVTIFALFQIIVSFQLHLKPDPC